MPQQRLIDILLARKLCADRDEARRLILAGAIRVNGHPVFQPAALIRRDAVIACAAVEQPVSRAGAKLDYALSRWKSSVEGIVAADIGAAAGGFTECLLRHNAARVYAIDTGKGQLAWKLRQDPRVVVMEETNILHLAGLPEMAGLVTIDVSWTPLRQALPHVARLLDPGGQAIALLKPNYEIQDPRRLVNGVLTDAGLRREVVDQFIEWAGGAGWQVLDAVESPVAGDSGNVEWLIHLMKDDGQV